MLILCRTTFDRIWLATLADWQQIYCTCFQSVPQQYLCQLAFNQIQGCCYKAFLLRGWSIRWFFNNHTFMLTQMSFIRNGKSGRHSLLDQSIIWVFHQFLLNITVFMQLSGIISQQLIKRLPVQLCICITKLHLSRISFFSS